jgi:N-acyl homoserine lactone hydrolase
VRRALRTLDPVPLAALPKVERLTLATVTAVPESHPEHATFEPFPVHGWVVRHPDGPLLLDTGIGIDNAWINQWYRPRITALVDALAAVELAPEDIAGVVLSHLHFDHCGQQGCLAAPAYVHAVEYETAQTPRYTVPEWAAIPPQRLRLVGDDEDIADGVRLLFTPGHTPGHQSVLLEAADQRVVLAAQCAFRARELRTGQPAATNLYDQSWEDSARDSLRRIRTLAPVTVQLSHDAEIVVIEP